MSESLISLESFRRASDAWDEKSKKNQKSIERFRYEDSAPNRFKSGMVPVNALEQKEKFLKFGISPEFELKATPAEVKRLVNDKMGLIKFNLFHEARRILDQVIKRYRTLDRFVESNYGPQLSVEQAAEKVHGYMVDHQLENTMDVIWCSELACSALMSSSGPPAQAGKPELRRYTLLVKSSSENVFLREKGIICLMDHEIGTHYYRSFNDGFQPWYSCREKYNLFSAKSYETMKTEEGLACVHTLLNSAHKLLTMPALLYYTCCLAEYLSFKQLFDHLGKYVKNREQRWKHCMRVKRGLPNVNDTGGYGKDQRYFEGAVEILRNLDNIDFSVLMSGKITWEESQRVRKLARTAVIKVPHFMRDMDKYKKELTNLAKINGLLGPPVKKKEALPPPIQMKAGRPRIYTANPFYSGGDKKGDSLSVQSEKPSEPLLTRDELLVQLKRLDLCRELKYPSQTSEVNACNIGSSDPKNCGCTIYTKPRPQTILPPKVLPMKGSSSNPPSGDKTSLTSKVPLKRQLQAKQKLEKKNDSAAANQVPVIIELETTMPLLTV